MRLERAAIGNVRLSIVRGRGIAATGPRNDGAVASTRRRHMGPSGPSLRGSIEIPKEERSARNTPKKAAYSMMRKETFPCAKGNIYDQKS